MLYAVLDASRPWSTVIIVCGLPNSPGEIGAREQRYPSEYSIRGYGDASFLNDGGACDSSEHRSCDLDQSRRTLTTHL